MQSHSHLHTLSVPAAHHHAPLSQSSSVLLLIENSLAMAAIWSDIRQGCLEPLLCDFDQANTKVFAVETLPVPSASSIGRGGIHHGGLDNIRFNGSPNNRLSTAKVNAAIDLLLNSGSSFNVNPTTTRLYGGRCLPMAQSDAFHLILVAASAPIDNPLLGIRQYAWFLLAEKLQKANISCHLVLARNGEDMSSLIGLYDKARWLQGAIDIHPQNEDGRYILKFAARAHDQANENDGWQPGGQCKYEGFPLHLPVESTVPGDYEFRPPEQEQVWSTSNAGTPPYQSNDDPGAGFNQHSLDPFFPTYPTFEASLASTPSQHSSPSPPFGSYS